MTVETQSTYRDQERAKYERCWADPRYRVACHSLSLWKEHRDLFPHEFRSAIDLGCGVGRLLNLWLSQGIDAYGIDIAANALDEAIDERCGNRFRLGCLWDPQDMDFGQRFDVGICTDVMEHIPPERVRQTLECIGKLCAFVVFKIAHEPNRLHPEEELHLTLQPAAWWVDQMNAVSGKARFVRVVKRSGFNDSVVTWTP